MVSILIALPVFLIVAATFAALPNRVFAATTFGPPIQVTDPSGTANSHFGQAVAISGDGNTIAIGAPGPGGGNGPDKVQIFTRSNDQDWSMEATLTSPAGQGYGFGHALALSQDGNRLVVGCPDADTAFTFQRTGNTWTKITTFNALVSGTAFGDSVAINPSGDWIAVGAPKDPDNQGRAFVFQFNTSSQQYSGNPQFGNQDTFSGRSLGRSVALSANGSKAIVGAPGLGNTTSLVYVFQKQTFNYWPGDANWVFLLYSNSLAGSSIDLSSDDAGGAIGAPQAENGKGMVFPFRNGDYGWESQSYGFELPVGSSPGDKLGTSVSAANGGQSIIAGAPGTNNSAGSFYSYERFDSLYQAHWEKSGETPNPDVETGAQFGAAVAISDDGKTAVIGAPGADRNSITDRGSAYIYQLASHYLTVSTSGEGTVTSNPAGIDCGNFCASKYDATQTVTLTATPGYGQQFTGWSGACTGKGTCQVNMTEARTVEATFSPKPASITVENLGNGNGTVTSQPAGIDCGTACHADFQFGTQVTLQVNIPDDSKFTGWRGACANQGTNPQCVVSVDGELEVSAGFIASQRTISIVRTGQGNGTVTSNPAGLDCSKSGCVGDFYRGETVTLTAKPARDSLFAGWGGECTGSGAKCQITLTEDQLALVRFTLKPGVPKPGENRVRVCGQLPGGGAFRYVKTRGITCRQGIKITGKARTRFCRSRNRCWIVPPMPNSTTYKGRVFVSGWRCQVTVKYERTKVKCLRGSKFALYASGS